LSAESAAQGKGARNPTRRYGADVKTAPRGSEAPYRTVRGPYFFASSAFAGAVVDADGVPASAAFMKSANATLLPPLTTAIGSSLPSFIVKIVISASLRSPLSSNSMWPVAPS
jgi:hypothetical protein